MKHIYLLKFLKELSMTKEKAITEKEQETTFKCKMKNQIQNFFKVGTLFKAGAKFNIILVL